MTRNGALHNNSVRTSMYVGLILALSRIRCTGKYVQYIPGTVRSVPSHYLNGKKKKNEVLMSRIKNSTSQVTIPTNALHRPVAPQDMALYRRIRVMGKEFFSCSKGCATRSATSKKQR